mmetsp:Transcript_32998/g.49849  ORF Transcript_32998/g.49849 Transcript_32998/m.49849 type:complete len:1160 (+) Transcript_32998:129-3608(+)
MHFISRSKTFVAATGWVVLNCFIITDSNAFTSPCHQCQFSSSGKNSRGTSYYSTNANGLLLDQDDATVVSGARPSIVLHDNDEFRKPDPDNREYRTIRLNNNLECLLISAPESDVEAAAVHVKAGHMDDPVSRPGLAHFHEHMLFLGTEKYPLEQEYESFLNQHGGSSNAYTDMEDTNYYFSVTPSESSETDGVKSNPTLKTSEALSGGLDRLAQFFIAPSFDQQCVDRELRAIDSEYRNSFTSDAWRNFQLLKTSASQKHPFSKFGCGNYQTLTQGGQIVNSTHSTGIKSLPVDDLKQFWKTHYQTYNLRLAVVGKTSLDNLQNTVEQTFGALPYSEGVSRKDRRVHPLLHSVDPPADSVFSNLSPYKDVPPAFGPEQLAKMRYVVPLVEARTLKLYFATPSLDDPILKESRPYRVVSHILGHESPGSLHAVLNELGYITSLSSGVGVSTSDFSLFALTLNLTPQGMKEKDFILDLVFKWIALIRDTLERDTKLMEAFHNELRQLSETNFRFRENGDVTDFCSKAAEIMFDYPEYNKILHGSVTSGPYDPAVAEAYLERLRPHNAMITIVSSDLASTESLPESGWLTEPWYGAKYLAMDIPKEQLEKWNNPSQESQQLKLPGLNEYIPTDFSLRCDDDNIFNPSKRYIQSDKKVREVSPPSIVLDRPGFRMWHKMDRTWRVPKTFLRLSLVSPNVYRSPRTMTLMRIYERMLYDDLNSYVYDAILAGSSYKVSILPTGVRISLRGYSEKLPFLLDTLTTRMLSLMKELQDSSCEKLKLKFRKALDNLLRETKNYRLDTPYEMANYNSRLMLEESAWYVNNYIREMEQGELTMRDCGLVAQDCLLGRLRAEALCHGNINEKEALQVVRVIDQHFQTNSSLPLLDAEVPVFRSMKLPTRSEVKAIFGHFNESTTTTSLVYQEVAYSDSEENNALELVLQAGCDQTLGYQGVALLDLFSHLAYNSAYHQLRTKEQLGYIVSAYVRKVTGGAWTLVIVLQSSVALPSVLEERSEAWLAQFREELDDLSTEQLAQETAAVVAQLLERDTKLSQEVQWQWGEIISTETQPSSTLPSFDRVNKIADQLKNKGMVQLKQELLSLFDTYFAVDAPERRALSTRIYNSKSRAEFDANRDKANVISNYNGIQQLKSCLGTYPNAPYWRR